MRGDNITRARKMHPRDRDTARERKEIYTKLSFRWQQRYRRARHCHDSALQPFLAPVAKWSTAARRLL